MIADSLAHLDSIIAEKSLLKHPFYVKWTKGELTRDDLKIYAKEYYHLARSVPAIVHGVLDRIPAGNDALRASIEHNMIEEQEHVGLWERFSLSLGISKDELLAHAPSAAVQKAVTDLVALANTSFEAGVAGMYAFEAELPAIARTKKEGLVEFYNLTSKDAHIYFDEHLKEEAHLVVWRNVKMDADTAKDAAEKSLAAQNQVLDAVCDTCGISMKCSLEC